MSYFAELIVGSQIDCALVDSEVTYIMLDNGTQITIHGLVIVQPTAADRARPSQFDARTRGTSATSS